MERVDPPTLRLGLIGFGDDEHYRRLLASQSKPIPWVPWAPVDADALWINGAHVMPGRGDLVRVPSGQINRPALSLNLAEVDRPIAFARPLAAGWTTTSPTFDPEVEDDTAAVLRAFEKDMEVLCIELALGLQIARRLHELTKPAFELTGEAGAVGVVQVNGAIWIAPGATVEEVGKADWIGTATPELPMPTGALQTSMAHVMWVFSGRSTHDVFPKRYRQGKIYFKRMPRVDVRLLRDPHLAVISELRTMAQTFDELKLSIGMGDAQLSQVLGALYFARAITTDARRAGAVPPAPGRSEGVPSDLNSDIGLPMPIPQRPGKRLHGPGPQTVPTPLGPR